MFARATVASSWMGRSQVKGPSSSDGTGSSVAPPDPAADVVGTGELDAPAVVVDDGAVLQAATTRPTSRMATRRWECWRMSGTLLMIGRSESRDLAPDARRANGVTSAPALDSAANMETTARTFSPGLKGVLAGETSLAMIDGEAGRLQYRGYPIGELVERGTYAQVAELLWTGDWTTDAHLACAPLPPAVLDVLRRLPPSTGAMDALRTAISAWGAVNGTLWPPTVEQARAITARRTDGTGGLRTPPRWPRADRTGPGARTRRRVPPAAHGSAARRRIGPGPGRLLRRRRRARLQRLDLHRPRDHQHPFGHRVGGGRRDRRTEGTVARRGAVGGRGPAPRDGYPSTRPRPGSARRWRAASG